VAAHCTASLSVQSIYAARISRAEPSVQRSERPDHLLAVDERQASGVKLVGSVSMGVWMRAGEPVEQESVQGVRRRSSYQRTSRWVDAEGGMV
jgi:hypothetical protein